MPTARWNQRAVPPRQDGQVPSLGVTGSGDYALRKRETAGPICLVLAATSVQAQPAEAIRGTVVDRITGEPIAGATVASGSIEVKTAADGSFELEVPAGWVDLVVVVDGYEPLVERARAGLPIRLRVSATDETRGSELITIEDKRELDAEPSSYDIGRDVVRTLPGTGNDALKSLQSLPGTARVPFGLGGLVLRGFAPADTNVFLDGIEVPILYHFGGLASFFPSTMIESMELVSSGYGPRYGRGQGGIVDIKSRAGRTDRWAVGSEMSLLDASVRAEGPVGGGNVSVGVRRSFVDLVLAAVPTGDLTLAPRYLDSQVRWQSRSGKLTAILFGRRRHQPRQRRRHARRAPVVHPRGHQVRRAPRRCSADGGAVARLRPQRDRHRWRPGDPQQRDRRDPRDDPARPRARLRRRRRRSPGQPLRLRPRHRRARHAGRRDGVS